MDVQDALRRIWRLVGEIPSAEGRISTVTCPRFSEESSIDLDLLAPLVVVPESAGVVGSEKESDVAGSTQAQEQIDQVFVDGQRPYVLGDCDRGVGKPLTVAGPDQYHRVDTGLDHGIELERPLLLAPILGGDVVRDLIQERARDGLVSHASFHWSTAH